MVKFCKCIGSLPSCLRKQSTLSSIFDTESSSVESEAEVSTCTLELEFVNSTQLLAEPSAVPSQNNSPERSVQQFCDKMAYESVLDVFLTIITSVFGAFDFVCKITVLLWDVFRPETNPKYLEGKNVLIVGGAGGLGSTVAKRMAKIGANVALWDIDEKRLKKVEEELTESGHKVISKVVDIRNVSEVNSAGKELDSFGVDILFNTAGYCHLKDSLEDSDERIERVVDTNYKGVVWVTRFFWRQFLEKRKGHIVSMASVAGIAGVPHLCEYTGTLHGVVGYMDALEADTFGRSIHDIKFTVLNPPFIKTPMATALQTTGEAKWPWVDVEECATQVIKGIVSNKRIYTFPWDAAVFCAFKSILPRRRFNLLNGRWWSY